LRSLGDIPVICARVETGTFSRNRRVRNARGERETFHMHCGTR
jgi:hypothetical protein